MLNTRYIGETDGAYYVFCDQHMPRNHSGELVRAGWTSATCDECDYERRRLANSRHMEGAC